MQKIKFSDSLEVMLFTMTISLFLPVDSAMATAELDVEEAKTTTVAKQTEATRASTRTIKQAVPKKIRNAQTIDEKEIFSFRVPPIVSGNVIPNIPDSLPELPADTLFRSSKYYAFKPSTGWRITARSLFEKPLLSKDIQLKLNIPSINVFKILQNQGNLPGWSLKDFSETARQIAFEFFDEDQPRTLIVVIKDVADGSLLRARVTPYATANSIKLSKIFLSRLQQSIEMKDVL